MYLNLVLGMVLFGDWVTKLQKKFTSSLSNFGVASLYDSMFAKEFYKKNMHKVIVE